MNSKTCRLYDVQLGPADVLGVALLAPGFCEDLTTWRLTIDESGLITQEIFLCCDPAYLSEKQTRTSQFTEEQLAQLLYLAQEIEFVKLNEEYDQDWIDDAATTTIVQRTPEGVKHVDAYAAHEAAEEGDADLQRYVHLWDAIVEHAPTSSAAWRQDRAEAERLMYIAAFKLRVREKDFVLPTLDNLVGALVFAPAIGLLLQLFSWNYSSGVREFPDVPQLILWSCIMYAVMILVFAHHVYSRRRDRLTAEQELAQLQSENSEFIDQKPKTEY